MMSRAKQFDNHTRAEPNCPLCGATLSPNAASCWLCHAAVVPGRTPDATPRSVSPSVRARPERLGGYSLATMMLFVTLIAVVVGLATIHAGVGIPLGVMLLVAWWRTAAVSRYRYRSDDSLTRAQQIQVFLSSFGLAIALIVMVGVGICVALGALCFGLIAVAGGAGSGPGDQIGSFAICVLAFFAAIGLIWAAVKWDRYSWRRDIGQTRESTEEGDRDDTS